MAMNLNAAPVANTPANDSWKAQGFLNFYITGADGKPKKLGAIGLKDSKVNEKRLMDWLNEDPTRVTNLLSKISIVYQSATPADGSGFDLS